MDAALYACASCELLSHSRQSPSSLANGFYFLNYIRHGVVMSAPSSCSEESNLGDSDEHLLCRDKIN